MRLTPSDAILRLVTAVTASACVFTFTSSLKASWREPTGVTRLGLTFVDVPTSAGILSFAEAGNSVGDNYLPDTSNFAFAGITILNKSPGSGLSGHATAVGGYFFGAINGQLTTTDTVHAYNASYWIETDFLRYNSTAAPLVEVASVQNHSWIANGDLTSLQIAEIGQRLDFAVQRDGFVAVAGVNNGTSTTLPMLLAQAYNLITVGNTNGSHSAGFTVHDGAGRIKPDLVAPMPLTSFSTPLVASAAGVLAARGAAAPHSLIGADRTRVVKALLLAGATKEEFPAWSRTFERPLDLRHGAGELNTLLAYRILESGRAAPSSSVLVPDTGWAAANLAGGAQHTYFFEVSAGAAAAPFSVALTWHRLVTDGAPGPNWSADAQPLINLDLALYTANDFTLGATLDLSASTVDNVEHIYAAALAPGRYALVVSTTASAPSTDYALAWRTTPSVSVIATGTEARELDGAPGEFTLFRHGSTATPLYVPVIVGGDALPGVHYTAVPAGVLIPAGLASITVAVIPNGDDIAQGSRTVTLAVVSDFSLASLDPAPAMVTVRDKPGDAWRFARFSSAQLADPAISGDTVDPDFDGLPNLLEYALGGSPLLADAGERAPTIGLDTNSESGQIYLVLTYDRPSDHGDLIYIVEWTSDLAGGLWQSGPAIVNEAPPLPHEIGGMERVFARADISLADQPRQFLRLRVTRL